MAQTPNILGFSLATYRLGSLRNDLIRRSGPYRANYFSFPLKHDGVFSGQGISLLPREFHTRLS
jgi:hypothetical protein